MIYLFCTFTIIMSQIFKTTLKASNQLLEPMQDGTTRYFMLVAQMQAGKTNTYTYVACEMIITGCAEKVRIICGNSELKLKEQLKKNIYDFVHEHYPNDSELLLNRIQIRWGHEIDKDSEIYSNTLFVWDESHYAQSQGNRPDKFFCRQGIEMSGDIGRLDVRNNFVLSVSATNFSEHSCCVHKSHNKVRVTLEVDDNYVGVSYFLRSGQIKGFDNCLDVLGSVLLEGNLTTNKHYIIIRIENNDVGNRIKIMGTANGYKVLNYNGKENEIGSLSILSVEPVQNTIILIKDLCRMGHVLDKKYIRMVMETQANSNTDTILQGLLGRVCGYSGQNRNIVIYLHNNIVNSGELEKYVKFFEEGGTVMPNKGMNIVNRGGYNNTHASRRELIPIIPLRVSASSFGEDPEDTDYDILNDPPVVIQRTKIAFRNGSYENRNSTIQDSYIINRVIKNNKFVVRNGELPTYKNDTLTAHKKMSETGIAINIGHSGEINNGETINLYYYKNSHPKFGVTAGDIFVDFRLPENDQPESLSDFARNRLDNIPRSNGKETFSRILGSENADISYEPEVKQRQPIIPENKVVGISIANNVNDADTVVPSKYIHILDQDTIHNHVSMQNYLKKAVHDHSIGVGPRQLFIEGDLENTEQRGRKKQIAAILVTEELYKSLKPKGEIYWHIFGAHKVKIKLHKFNGRRDMVLVSKGLVRLKNITW